MISRGRDIFFIYSFDNNLFDNPVVNKNFNWITFDRGNIEPERYTMKKYYNMLPGFFVINTPVTPVNYITKIIHKLEKSTNYIELRR